MNASLVTSFVRSPVLQKALMAVTGVILFGFVLGHMVGNMKLYLGPEALDHYAVFLREMGSPLFPHGVLLWIARVVLLASVALHIGSAYNLTMISRAARPVAYRQVTPEASTYASRTMRFGGIIIFLFVVFHILHLTTGTVHGDFIEGSVYHNVVRGFQVLPVAAFYILAQLALGFHLEHGLWSLFQSLGLSHPRFNAWRRGFARAFAIIITAGNISFPLAVLSGLVA